VEGEGGEHDERAPPDGKKEPRSIEGGFDRGIGRAPVPGGESEEKKCGREWVGAPQEQIGGGKREVEDEKNEKERESGWAMKDPSWNPEITSTVRNA
jgi:hypothetical protein